MAHLLENEDDDDFYKQKYGEEIFRDSNSEFDEDECEHASKAVLVCSDESMIVLIMFIRSLRLRPFVSSIH